eukprot:TRINITY_DN65720_c0_g1_i1.p1 TRINITY_DN65720_c0_g1~~TRINITY_DN65720_c0_g1_i1.p1  ORF type:complete len:441 (+),score=111.12 TRINITY_DN65720_c0_g1_i1:94-1323(+)
MAAAAGSSKAGADDSLGIVDIPSQSLWGMGAAIHTPTSRDAGAAAVWPAPSPSHPPDPRSPSGSEGPPAKCASCQRLRAHHVLFAAPKGQWRPPHCAHCMRRQLHQEEDGYWHCKACELNICADCHDVAQEEEDGEGVSDAYALSEQEPPPPEWGALAAPLLALAAAAAGRYVAEQRTRDAQQRLTRAELAIAAVVQPVSDAEVDARHEFVRLELRERLRLLTDAADARQRVTTSNAELLAQQLAARRAADATARREALEAVMAAARGTAPVAESPRTPSDAGAPRARGFAVGDHVRYRDKGTGWRDGVVAAIDGGRPKVADGRRLSSEGACAREEVVHWQDAARAALPQKPSSAPTSRPSTGNPASRHSMGAPAQGSVMSARQVKHAGVAPRMGSRPAWAQQPKGVPR